MPAARDAVIMGKKILVTCSSMPPFEEYTDEIKGLWESVWLTNSGAKHQKIAKDHPGFFTKRDRKVSIQVGHNAFPFNRHAADLSMLEPYKSQNILITMPMSYGNDYGNQNASYNNDLTNLAYGLFSKEKIRILDDREDVFETRYLLVIERENVKG